MAARRSGGVALAVSVERWPIRGGFTISRGAKHEAVVVVAAISDGTHTGRGECVPYARYGESVEGVVAAHRGLRRAVASGLEPGRARRACCPPARRETRSIARCGISRRSARAGAPRRSPGSARSIPCSRPSRFRLASPEAMAAQAREAGALSPAQAQARRRRAMRSGLPPCARPCRMRGSSSMPTRPGNRMTSNRFLPRGRGRRRADRAAPPRRRRRSLAAHRRGAFRSAPTSRCMTAPRSPRSPSATTR